MAFINQVHPCIYFSYVWLIKEKDERTRLGHLSRTEHCPQCNYFLRLASIRCIVN